MESATIEHQDAPQYLLDILVPSTSKARSGAYHNGQNPEHLAPSDATGLRPHVTLTFAQSLDAKIAGAGGKQLILSGRESMVMTHWMRTQHDAILVGIGTALNDDPQLNTRHLPPASAGRRYFLPRPVILDANLRLSPDCKLLKNYRAGAGRRPWIFTGAKESSGRGARRQTLAAAGAHIVEVPYHDGKLSIPDVLSALSGLGVRLLMVEGGASVIQSFLSAKSSLKPVSAAVTPTEHVLASVIDRLVVTVAPTLVGRDGVSYGDNILAAELPDLRHLDTQIFGHDTVVAFRSVLG